MVIFGGVQDWLVWARLFMWLLLHLKQPHPNNCLVNTKTQFNFDGAHYILRLKRRKNESSFVELFFTHTVH